jgi:predicted O-methyltransferase YrrM
MEHFYKSIDGYFTFPYFYKWVAEQMASRTFPHLVEVGVYTGQSAAFLGVELVNRGVDARLDLVDLFVDGGSAAIVLDRLKPVSSVIGRASAGYSWEVAKLYDDASLDFCFIDANHSYECVARDIDAWKPKVKRGGILAGHDYIDWPGFGVMRAVSERFSRFEVWPGVTDGGDAQMQGKFWPCWSVQT